MKFTTPNADTFRQSVAQYCKGLDSIAIGCLGEQCEYANGDPEHSCEPSFSWGQCDSCGSTLGGDRDIAYGHWRDSSGEFQQIEMSVCVDCTMYHANGELPEHWEA